MEHQTVDTLPTVETAKALGLLPQEYTRITEIMGRQPNFTELSIFSVMWSEHCSYKNSIAYLKTLPREGAALLVEAGEENAGLVDIGDGYACAFKIESHNHPSAVEPYQGAATGVGGIHRDIFTMGARPVAALNSLRFGDPATKRTKHLIRGVVRGIGDYGNCLGVPTVAGEVFFHPSFEQNILVNAMSVGILEPGQSTVSATAGPPGNRVFIVGSATGKDGIHGATFASAELTEDSAEDLPSVQVGDPFEEKLLLEASLEAIATGAIVGMQDMGAAGITCSTSEMSAKSGSGILIDLDKVPTRQDGMQPFEILLSESQERMLIVCEQGREEDMIAVFDKWGVDCTEIGEVTDTGHIQFLKDGTIIADVPADDLVLGGGAPVYQRETKRPDYMKTLVDVPMPNLDDNELINAAKTVFSSPNIVSKHWVYDQYDGTVRTNSMTNTRPCDAAVIRIKGTKRGIAMTVDCNPTYVHADPYKGALSAVSEAARNLVATGARPLAVTNCLNFGNPYNPEVYFQFVNVIKGMGDACRQFDTPVTGGNVSFYNQTVLPNSNIPVYPTPTIGMIGLIEDVDTLTSLDFKDAGDHILLIGQSRNDLNSSVFSRDVMDIKASKAPHIDIEEEQVLHEVLSDCMTLGLLKSSHDVSDGGLWTTLAESAIHGNYGFDISKSSQINQAAWLFGESHGRYVVSVSEEHIDRVRKICRKVDVALEELGHVTDEREIIIDDLRFGNIDTWKTVYDDTLENVIEGGASV